MMVTFLYQDEQAQVDGVASRTIERGKSNTSGPSSCALNLASPSMSTQETRSEDAGESSCLQLDLMAFATDGTGEHAQGDSLRVNVELHNRALPRDQAVEAHKPSCTRTLQLAADQVASVCIPWAVHGPREHLDVGALLSEGRGDAC
eukprot:465398-Hanusia_phi.AAC.2